MKIVLPIPRTWGQWTVSLATLGAVGLGLWAAGHWAYMRHEDAIVNIQTSCEEIKAIVADQKTDVAKVATGVEAQGKAISSLELRVGDLTKEIINLARTRQVAAADEAPALIAAPYPGTRQAASRTRLAAEGGLE